ncbi:MAG: response regulator, partial [Okeania sp. SIO3B3]|nr:response regulator [Okeania sp. SIO3B3]
MINKVIVCVDDELLILESIKYELKKVLDKSINIELAESANEAFDLIDDLVEDQQKILIIVADWLMPDIKGDEFLISIHQKYPNIIKILLTGQADEKIINRV